MKTSQHSCQMYQQLNQLVSQIMCSISLAQSSASMMSYIQLQLKPLPNRRDWWQHKKTMIIIIAYNIYLHACMHHCKNKMVGLTNLRLPELHSYNCMNATQVANLLYECNQYNLRCMGKNSFIWRLCSFRVLPNKKVLTLVLQEETLLYVSFTKNKTSYI